MPPTNAPDIVPSAFPCCDNCIQRRRAIPDAILTDAETKVLSLIDRIQAGSFPIPDASQEVIDVGANSPMRRRGERFKVYAVKHLLNGETVLGTGTMACVLGVQTPYSRRK